jgi:hypothetical protein
VLETVITAIEKSLGCKAPTRIDLPESSKDAELRAAMDSLTEGGR